MIEKVTQELMDDLWALNKYIYDNPELGHQEFKSSEAHIKLLEKYGFTVEREYKGVKTGFRAEFKKGDSKNTVAYLAEYDALPKVGHGCGHNILGTLSTGAAIQLALNSDEFDGRVVVIGTPAEETDGAKVTYARTGAFDDIDAALIAHPYCEYVKSGISFAIRAFRFTFHGKSAHAAAVPETGINALDSCIATFNNIGLLRQQIRPDARIHGIITKGGDSINTIPDLAEADFYVRSTSRSYLDELSEKVENCAKAGALAAGAKLEISHFEAGNDNLITNNALQDTLTKNWQKLGVTDIHEAGDANGSTDVGDVSHVCPTIHPSFNIMAEGEFYSTHTDNFREATLRDPAYNSLRLNVAAMAMTGRDILTTPELIAEIRREFEESVRND